MPPRKKAAAAAAADTGADGSSATTTRPTRSSARTKAPVSATAATANTTKPASKAPATKGKGKKRARADEDEDDAGEDDAPTAKKAKADDKDVADDADDKPPKKMVTVVKRGAAPVDEHSMMTDTHQVFANDEDVWDTMLNQTDLGKNANKFYVIQLLHPIGNTSTVTLFTRWGRVGENGQQQKKGPFSASTGISEFKKQFKSKTGTEWYARRGMTAKKGKYTWIERSYGDDDEEEAESSKPKSKKDKQQEVKIPDSTLAKGLQDFVRLVFNTDYVNATLTSMNYDANKLPLGKLAKSTLLNGFAALKELAEIINNPSGTANFQSACNELSGRYYSIIPHSFGRQRPTTINNAELLKRELDLVDALGDMEIAQELIQSSIHTDDAGNPINPLDAHFRSLGLTSMEPIDRTSKEFLALNKYTQDTHGATHRHYKVQVQHAFRVDREAESAAWKKAGHGKLKDGERLLLWHGSRSTNFAGILKQGLRIAPPEAPVTGYMFGKGVYFADMMSKSANYCHAHLSDNTGVLLLCEVAAKPFFEQLSSNYNADEDSKKAKALATKGIGRTQPVKWQDAGDALDNDALKGCHMPAGPGEDVSAANPGAYLQYNEYIVYDTSQIRLKYLLMVKMG